MLTYVKKKNFIPLMMLFIGLFFTGCGEKKEASAYAQDDPPNILWIVSEDNSPLIGAYGDSFATTPQLDQFASQGILYENAFATAPVCAPSRSSLITGIYPPSMGTQNMRSTYSIPDFIKFFPKYLREAGYYCTNNAKKDYNTVDQPEAWDESSRTATYMNRKSGQPFFAIFNFNTTHESKIHKPLDSLKHDPKKVPVPAYHPRTPEMEHDWAQYYDKMEELDTKVGEVLKELEENGLADNTIVFYYSDHGGVLGRSKRFLFESGLHVPLIIRFPEKYKNLAPGKAGSSTDRIISFVDFAPTVLSLAGVKVPDYMQGQAFLGAQKEEEREYAFSFRDRMDEVYDLSRSVRDKRFRYTRNYMPHRIYGQYLDFLWRAPSMESWQQAYYEGKLNDEQSAFWEPKPAEELYDVTKDPDNIHNLASDPEYEKELKRFREANIEWTKKIYDSGFMPEAEMVEKSEESSIYEYVRSDKYPLEKILKTAEMASMGKLSNLKEFIKRLGDSTNAVRYWAATGCVILKDKAMPAKPVLEEHLNDPSPNVVIASAEALYYLGEKEKAVEILSKALSFDDEKVRLHAMNVLRAMGNGALPALDEIKALVKKYSEDSKAFDVRVAHYIIDKLEKNSKSG
jgi:N-sulfoglucosamine sulfohydrolase